jgi:hypothetical protein
MQEYEFTTADNTEGRGKKTKKTKKKTKQKTLA